MSLRRSEIVSHYAKDDEDYKQEKHLEILLSTINHFFGSISQIFKGIEDTRNKNRIDYSLECELFTGILMYLCHLGSRREIKHQLRDNVRSQGKYKSLFNVDSVPHGDSLNYTFKSLDIIQTQESVCGLVETLIGKKVLYPWRLLDRYYRIALDGTGIITYNERHCAHCLSKKLKNGKTLYYHPVLEAKLLTPNGFAFSIMTEFIENNDPHDSKQDCELKAFYRLSKRLKERFPRLPICLLLDGLYAGGPTFKMCEEANWKYFIILQDSDLKQLNEEFERLAPVASANRIKFKKTTGKEVTNQRFRWINDIYYEDSNHYEHYVSVLECLEKKSNKKGNPITTKFKWITNFNLTAKNVIPLANQGGRLRWKIENEGFNAQKNGGFDLEHSYSDDENARKVFYFLLQIAHTIFQLIAKGSLFRKAFPDGVGSLKNIAKRLLEAWRNCRINPFEFIQLGQKRVRISFYDTS